MPTIIDDRDVGAYIGVVVQTYDESRPGQIQVEIAKTTLNNEKQALWMPYVNQADLLGVGFNSIPQTGDNVLVLILGSSVSIHMVALGGYNGILDGVQHMDKEEYGRWASYNGMWIKDDITWDKLQPKLDVFEVFDPNGDAKSDPKIPLQFLKVSNAKREQPAEGTNGAAAKAPKKAFENITSFATNNASIVFDEQDPDNPRVSISVFRRIDMWPELKNRTAPNYPVSVIEISAKHGIRIFTNKDLGIYVDNLNMLAKQAINLTAAMVSIDASQISAIAEKTIDMTSKGDVLINSEQNLYMNNGEAAPEAPQSLPDAVAPPPLDSTDLLVNLEIIVPRFEQPNRYQQPDVWLPTGDTLTFISGKNFDKNTTSGSIALELSTESKSKIDEKYKALQKDDGANNASGDVSKAEDAVNLVGDLIKLIFKNMRIETDEVDTKDSKEKNKRLIFKFDLTSIFKEHEFEEFNELLVDLKGKGGKKKFYVSTSSTETKLQPKGGKDKGAIVLKNPYNKFVGKNSGRIGIVKQGGSNTKLFHSSRIQFPETKVAIGSYDEVNKKISKVAELTLNDSTFTAAALHSASNNTATTVPNNSNSTNTQTAEVTAVNPFKLYNRPAGSHFDWIHLFLNPNVDPFNLKLKNEDDLLELDGFGVEEDANYKKYLSGMLTGSTGDSFNLSNIPTNLTVVFKENNNQDSTISDFKIQLIRRSNIMFSEDTADLGLEIGVTRKLTEVEEEKSGRKSTYKKVRYEFTTTKLGQSERIGQETLNSYQTGEVAKDNAGNAVTFFDSKNALHKMAYIPYSAFSKGYRDGAWDSFVRVHNLFKFKERNTGVAGAGDTDTYFHDIEDKSAKEVYESSIKHDKMIYYDNFPAKGIYPVPNVEDKDGSVAGNTLVIDVSDQFSRVAAGIMGATGALASGLIGYVLGSKINKGGDEDKKTDENNGVVANKNTGELDMHDVSKGFVTSIPGTDDKIGKIQDGPAYQSNYYFGDKVTVKFKRVAEKEFKYRLSLQAIDNNGSVVNLLDTSKNDKLTFSDTAEHEICLNDYLKDQSVIPVGAYYIALEGIKEKDTENDITAAIGLNILAANCDLFVNDKSAELSQNASKITTNYGSISNYVMGKYSRYKSGTEFAFDASYQFNVASKLSSNAGVDQRWQLHIYPAADIDTDEDFLGISTTSQKPSDNKIKKAGGGDIEPIWSSGEIKFADRNSNSVSNTLVQTEVNGNQEPLDLKVGDYIVAVKGEVVYGEPDGKGGVRETGAKIFKKKDILVLTVRSDVEIFNNTHAYAAGAAVVEKQHGYFQKIYQGSERISDVISSDDGSYKGYNYYLDDFPYLDLTFSFTDKQEHTYTKTLVNIGTGQTLTLTGEDKFEDGYYTLNLDGITPEAGYYKLTIADKDDETVMDTMYFRLYAKSTFNVVFGGSLRTAATSTSPAVYPMDGETILANVVYNAFKVGTQTQVAGYYRITKENDEVVYTSAIVTMQGGSKNTKTTYNEKVDPSNPASGNIVTNIPVYDIESGKSIIMYLEGGYNILNGTRQIEFVLVNISEGFKTITTAVVAK